MIRTCILVLILLGALSCKEVAADKKPTSDSVESAVADKDLVGEEHKVEEDTTESIEMAKDCNQSFDDFFGRFAKDSVFQKNRVKYPMEWFFYGDASYENLDKEIISSKDRYRYFDFTADEKAIEKEYGAFKVEKDKYQDSLVYKRIGLDSGLMMNFKFNLIDGCWYLVEILDEST